MEAIVLSDTMVEDTPFDTVDVRDIPIPETPYVDPVTREAADLFLACDQIDLMPDSEARDDALAELLARIDIFETSVPSLVKHTVLETALKMI